MAVVFERPSLWRRFVPFLKGFDFWLLLSVCMLAGMGLLQALLREERRGVRRA